MNGFLVPAGKVTFVDSNGRPLSNGKVAFYQVGTQTPKNTWKDIGKTVINTNPIILDARGQASIYGEGSYRQVLKTASDVTIWDQVINDPQSAASISYTFPDGTVRPIQDLAGDDGGYGIGYNGSTVGDTLDELSAKHDAAKTYTVGVGGDYTTLNQALAGVTAIFGPIYKQGGIAIILQLMTSYQMNEQVIVDGIDLGWITITSVEPMVRINHLAVTEVLTANDATTPAFGGRNNATLPIIGTLFNYDSNAVARDGVAVHFNSHVVIKPECGIQNCRRGIQALYGSSVNCYIPGLTQGGAGSGAGTTKGADFRNCSLRACHIGFNSTGGLARSNFTFCIAAEAVYVIWGSTADIYQSQINDCTGTAVSCRDGSLCNARETRVSRSNRGYHALHGAKINARSRPASELNPWVGDGAINCTDYAVLSSYNSTVECANLTVSGSRIGVHASNASVNNFYRGTALNCTQYGVYATDASTIGAQESDCSGSDTGYYSERGSTVSAADSKALNCGERGYYAAEGSIMAATNGQASGCASEGFFAARGSTIEARGGQASGCLNAIRAIEGSTANAYNFTGTGSTGDFDIVAERGATIAAGTSTGTINIAANTITSSGIIYQ